MIPWWSNIHNNCLVTLFLINNNIRSSGLNNVVTLDGHVPQYLTSFIVLYLIRLVFTPLLISVQAILTAELPIGQPGNVVMSSALVLFSRQTLTLTNYMIYCFALLATQPTKRGVHEVVHVELSIVCSQCLYLGCKNRCFSFISALFQLSGICRVNWRCIFFLCPSIQGGILSVLFEFILFLCPPPLFRIFVFLTTSINLSFKFLTY